MTAGLAVVVALKVTRSYCVNEMLGGFVIMVNVVAVVKVEEIVNPAVDAVNVPYRLFGTFPTKLLMYRLSR